MLYHKSRLFCKGTVLLTDFDSRYRPGDISRKCREGGRWGACRILSRLSRFSLSTEPERARQKGRGKFPHLFVPLNSAEAFCSVTFSGTEYALTLEKHFPQAFCLVPSCLLLPVRANLPYRGSECQTVATVAGVAVARPRIAYSRRVSGRADRPVPAAVRG